MLTNDVDLQFGDTVLDDGTIVRYGNNEPDVLAPGPDVAQSDDDYEARLRASLGFD